MEKKETRLSVKLCESAMMIALATILSLFKLVDLPYGGSITFASMLPILLIAYRYGTAWGLFTGFVHGVLQLVLSTSTLSYVTGAASVAAVIILDYLAAFALIGLGGLCRGIKDQRKALALGAVIACVLRYVCHVISGATVWVGLSIPTAGALDYSFAYNATYMLPELIILMIAGFYIGSAIDFRTPRLSAYKKDGDAVSIPSIVFGALFSAALVFDVASVFGCLQDGETGEFDITGIANVNWIAVAAVTAAAVVIAAVFYAVWRQVKASGKKD